MIYISLGSNCILPHILRVDLKISQPSYPFDWYSTQGDQVFVSNIQFNIDIVKELLTKEKTCRELAVILLSNNDMIFPHDSSSMEHNINKYERRFERLYSTLMNDEFTFIISTRKCLLDKESIEDILQIKNIIHNNNKVLFISGIDHDYIAPYSNTIHFKYINYDERCINCEYDIEFRKQIVNYLTVLINNFELTL
jgi:hypothetical protein